MTAGGWRAREVLQEAARNALNWRSRQIVAILTSIALGLGLATTITLDWRFFLRDLAQLGLQGRNVLIARSLDKDDPALISISSCEALITLAGVRTAGAVRPIGTVSEPQLGSRVPVVAVSQTLLPELRDFDALIGAALDRPQGPATLVLGDGILSAAVIDPLPDTLGLNTTVMVSLEDWGGSTRECFVWLEDTESARDLSGLVNARLESTGGDIVVDSPLTETYDMMQAFRERGSRWLPVAVGIVGGLIGVVMLLMRSSELAAYRFSGTRQSDLFRILLAEQVLIGGVAVLFCSFGLTVASWVVPGIPWTVLLSSWVVGTTWVASFSLIAGALTLRNPATLARER